VKLLVVQDGRADTDGSWNIFWSQIYSTLMHEKAYVVEALLGEPNVELQYPCNMFNLFWGCIIHSRALSVAARLWYWERECKFKYKISNVAWFYMNLQELYIATRLAHNHADKTLCPVFYRDLLGGTSPKTSKSPTILEYFPLSDLIDIPPCQFLNRKSG
jgi:hypothetical protein